MKADAAALSAFWLSVVALHASAELLCRNNGSSTGNVLLMTARRGTASLFLLEGSGTTPGASLVPIA